MAYYNKFPMLLLRGYEPETMAYIAAMTGTPPSAGRTRLYNNFIKNTKAEGILQTCDFAWLTANFTDEAARINLINPGTGDLVNSNTPTFAADDGFTGSSTGTVHNNVAMNTYTKYQQNDCHIAMHNRVEYNAAIRAVSSAGSTGPFSLLFARNSGNASWWLNDDTGTAVAQASAIGTMIGVRTGATATRGHKNGSTLGTGSVTSTGVPTGTFHLCGHLGAGNASQIAFASVGSSLTEDQANSYANIINEYLTAVGAI